MFVNSINPDPEEVRAFAHSAPEGPIAMLNLMRLKGGVSLEEFLGKLGPLNAPFVAKGEVIYGAQGLRDFLSDEHWDLIVLFKYKAFSDFVDIVCNEDWRRTAGAYREEALEAAKLIFTQAFPDS